MFGNILAGFFYFTIDESLSFFLRFHKMLGSDEMRAWYGPDHVQLAADRGAIGTLLISDELFRLVFQVMASSFPFSTQSLFHLQSKRPRVAQEVRQTRGIRAAERRGSFDFFEYA